MGRGYRVLEMSRPCLKVLLALEEAGGSMELGRVRGLWRSPSIAYLAVKELVYAGLATLKPGEGSRGQVVSLTEAGREVARALWRVEKLLREAPRGSQP